MGTKSIENNHFEYMNQSQPLSAQQLLMIQNEIYHQIQLAVHQLVLIKEKAGSLVEKWQELLEVILPIQMQVIQSHNLENSQSGLSKFNEEYSRCALGSAALCELNKQKWLFIFDKAFGITEFKEISLQQAQSLIVEIAKEMTSEDFLIQIDQVLKALKPHASLIEKRKAVLTILFPLHLSVMTRHGFGGETGYIQAQRAIMDYYHDPLISQRAAYAQSVVFKRAQLI